MKGKQKPQKIVLFSGLVLIGIGIAAAVLLYMLQYDELWPEEALEIFKQKRGGRYNVVQIDPDFVPSPEEYKDVFGITFQQGRNNFKIDEELLGNIVTENKNLPVLRPAKSSPRT